MRLNNRVIVKMPDQYHEVLKLPEEVPAIRFPENAGTVEGSAWPVSHEVDLRRAGRVCPSNPETTSGKKRARHCEGYLMYGIS